MSDNYLFVLGKKKTEEKEKEERRKRRRRKRRRISRRRRRSKEKERRKRVEGKKGSFLSPVDIHTLHLRLSLFLPYSQSHHSPSPFFDWLASGVSLSLSLSLSLPPPFPAIHPSLTNFPPSECKNKKVGRLIVRR